MPLSTEIVEFFVLLDKSGNGRIDFRSFLIGLAFIGDTAARVENGVDLLYHCFDPENTGKISRKRVEEILDRVFRKVDPATTKRLFARVDPNGTGFVSRKKFEEFLLQNPELLVLGVKASKTFEQRQGEDRKLTVYSPAEAKEKLGEIRAETFV